MRTPVESDVYGNWWKWFNDEEVTKYLDKGHERNTVQKQMEFFKKYSRSKKDLILAICDKDTEKHIGATAIHSIQNDKWFFGYFGIVIGEKDFWNKGFGTEVWRLMTQHAFDNLKLDFLMTKIFTDNKAALRIAQKMGFKIIRRLKKDIIKNGKGIDRLLLRLDSNL